MVSTALLHCIINLKISSSNCSLKALAIKVELCVSAPQIGENQLLDLLAKVLVRDHLLVERLSFWGQVSGFQDFGLKAFGRIAV